VRLIYIDEAGLSRPQEEPYLTVAGVIVNADKELDQIEGRLGEIIKRHIPEEHQKDFVFHAHEFMSGRGIFDKGKVAIAKRLEIAKALAQIIVDLKLPLPYGYIEKKHFPQTVTPNPSTSPSELLRFAHVSAFMSCAVQIDQWMRLNAKGEVCALIVEHNSNSQVFMKETQLYHQDKDIPGLTDEQRKYFPLQKIKEEPWFQEKRKLSPLQLADFCAYIYKRLLMDQHHKYCRPLYDMLHPYVIQTSYLMKGIAEGQR
jgi:hypothetical protein